MITAIVCTKDRTNDFKELVQSLAIQTRPIDELIVVDASDTNDLVDYCESLVGHFQIRCFRTSPGVTRQRNFGVRHSTGHLLFFLDDDVVLEPNYIEQILRVFETDIDRKIGAVMGRILVSKDWLVKSSPSVKIRHWLKSALADIFLQIKSGDGRFRYSGFSTHPQDMTDSCYVECLSVGCTAFRREVFQKVTFDENLAKRGYSYMDDVDLSKQLLDTGYKVFYQARARLLHKRSPGGRLSRFEIYRMVVLHHNYLFHKNWPQTPFRKLAFWWSVIGLVIINVTKPEQLRGILSGLKSVLTHRSSLAALESEP